MSPPGRARKAGLFLERERKSKGIKEAHGDAGARRHREGEARGGQGRGRRGRAIRLDFSGVDEPGEEERTPPRNVATTSFFLSVSQFEINLEIATIFLYLLPHTSKVLRHFLNLNSVFKFDPGETNNK